MDNGDSDLLEQLLEGKRALRAAVAGVSEADAKRRPAEGRWSVLENVEHIAVVEDRLFKRVTEEAEQSRCDEATPERARMLAQRVRDRSEPRQAPEPVHPTQRFASLDAALRHFEGSRDRLIEYARDHDADLRATSTIHPVAGRISCHEATIMAANHPVRHASQIREIREQLQASAASL